MENYPLDRFWSGILKKYIVHFQIVKWMAQ